MASKGFAEDRMGQKIDRCFSDAAIKAGESINEALDFFVTSDMKIIMIFLSGVGLVLGGVFSVFFFKRRMWSMYGGTFFGLGVAYNNCEKALNSN